MTADQLAALLEKATNALADIACLLDAHNGRTSVTVDTAQHKAQRIYDEIRAVWEGPGPDDDTPPQEEVL